LSEHQPTYVSTEQYLESTPTEGVPVAEGLPEEVNGIGDSKKKKKERKKKQTKKTTETESRSPLSTVYACTASRQSIPGKIWKPTNQIRAISAGAHVSREFHARALQASPGI